MSVFLLVTRLLSTSMMPLVNDQASQALVAGLLSLGCMGALLLVQPFREQSNNAIVVSGQVVIFLWIYFLLCRVIGIAEGGGVPPEASH